MSKVFLLNGYDWVYADNEEQAIKYYIQFTGCLKDDVEKIKEVSLQDTMYYEVSRLPEEERVKAHKFGWFAGEFCALKTFEWVINHENIKVPSILATIEG
jgi:hypothetical protein